MSWCLSRSHPVQAALAIAFVCLICAGCDSAGGGREAVASYDQFTSRLISIGADLNGDGRLDQWTYMDGNRPLRGEADTDGDGRIDRWEYFDAQAGLRSVGTSSRNDGLEDTWSFVDAADGTRRVERARARDRHIDRREFYREESLIRVEEDTNADGLVDKWERYEANVIREVAFDTQGRAGRPDRRIIYDARGRFEGIETDPAGTGVFVRLPGTPPVPREPGA